VAEAAVVVALATGAMGQSLHLTPKQCPAGVKAISSCPNTGCGGVSDSLLDVAKNRTDAPPADPPVLQVHDIVAIEEPEDWLTGQERDSLSENEGRPVRLMGYLKIVKTETSGETCNCELHKQVDTDLHLAITEHKADVEGASVTAEITPRVRAATHPEWMAKKIVPLQGKFIRVTGWLMLDTAHLPHSKKVDPQDHGGSSLNRATNWEVHPVLAMEVCTSTVKSCKQGTGWKAVD
jgi:hypothetical protein